MKKLLLLLFSFTAFQATAQFKSEELSATQKQQVSEIESAYNNTLDGQKASISYNEFMLEISNGDKTQKLSLFDIKSISVEQNNDGYYLKLHHVGGWSYDAFYKISGQKDAETIKSQLQMFLDDFDPFSSKFLADLCDDTRKLRTSKDDVNFYAFEYKMLKLAGVTDIDNTSDEVLKRRMSYLWKRHSNDFQCVMASGNSPRGNYLRQLVRADGDDAIELVLDNYGFDPNVIDEDGCTVLDYLNAQIAAVNDYSYILIDKFKKYKTILLRYGAKSANDFEGCKC